MSQISDTISRVGLDAAFQFVHGEPAFAVLRPLMTRPCRILPALAELGIETEADLLGFVGRLSDALGPRREAFLRLAAPVIDPDAFDLPSMPPLSGALVHKAVWDAMPSKANWPVFAADGQYRLLTRRQAEHIAERMPVYAHEGTEALDCDDQVRIVRGWLSTQGLGNLATGLIGVQLHTADGRQQGHALLFVVLDDRSVVLLDCKERTLRAPDYLGYLDTDGFFGIGAWRSVAMDVSNLDF